MSSVIQDLQWRYATKKFDPAKKISDADLHELLESLRLAPSSFGLQPWKFLVITDPKVRSELLGHSWNQTQVTEASHLIVLCAHTNVDEAYVKRYVESVAHIRGVPKDALKGYEDMMVGFVNRLPKDAKVEWAKKQVYIALGMLMTACAHKRIDSCPMEGFDAVAYDKILDLHKQNLTATVLLPVGYRAHDDKTATFKKVRFENKDMIEIR
jgi:nitroreductase